jgi:hypothetical protein
VQKLPCATVTSGPVRRRAGSMQVSHCQAFGMTIFAMFCLKNKQNWSFGSLRGGLQQALLRRSINYNSFDPKYPGHSAPDGHTHVAPLPEQTKARGDPENGPGEQCWCPGRAPVACNDREHGKNDRLTITSCVPIIALARLCYIFVARV